MQMCDWLSWLLPPTCILCDNPGLAGKDICAYCLAGLVKNTPCCRRCGCLFSAENSAATVCGQCLKKPPPFKQVSAPFVYQGATAYLIKQLKFHRHYKHARLLGQLLAENLNPIADYPQCIMPVPLHKNRYRQRGFNQSLEIARTVSKQLQIPLDIHSCIRQRDTVQQAQLPAKQRAHNMKNAFALIRPLPYQHVAVLDDVMTTGATVTEITQVLTEAGVEKVQIWVCARA